VVGEVTQGYNTKQADCWKGSSLHPTPTSPDTLHQYPESARLNVADGDLEVVQILLQLGVLLGHLLVLGLPLVALRLEGLHLALVVAGLDVGLAEPVNSDMLARSVDGSV
jgi:hypothetical protein